MLSLHSFKQKFSCSGKGECDYCSNGGLSCECRQVLCNHVGTGRYSAAVTFEVPKVNVIAGLRGARLCRDPNTYRLVLTAQQHSI
jgi:hypothetical protein